MGESQKLTLSDVEEMTNEVARKYAHDEYGISPSKIRVILWPTDKFICAVERGPTAVIRLGILPNHPEFRRALKNAIGLVHRKKMYESTEIELLADIQRREQHIKRNLWKTYGFDPSRLPGMLKPEEVQTQVLTRVEAFHAGTGIREVVEVTSGSVFGAMRLVEARLARRVAEIRQIEQQVEEITRVHPWDLPTDHPDWVARTV